VDCHVTRLTVCPVHPHHLPRHLTPASAARRHSGLARTRLSCQVFSPTSHRPSTLSSMDRNVSCTVYYSVSQKKQDAKLLPMKKVAHTRLPSIGFRSWSRFLAVSLQVMWVINLAVGNRYFSPGPQLPPQSLRGLLPVLLLGEQRHSGFEQFAQDSIATAICNLPIASTNINRFSNFLLLSLPVKEFWKSLNIWGSCGNSSSSWFFWLTVYKRPSINAILQQDCSRFICMSLHRVCAWFDFAILANKCFHSLIWSK